jgi:hypothetical protein
VQEFGETMWMANLNKEKHCHSLYLGGLQQDVILREGLLLKTEILWKAENRERSWLKES